MITVQCTYLNPTTMMSMSSLEKQFTEPSEFAKFYLLAKSDPYVLINITLGYNPVDKPSLKGVYDAQLSRLGRELPV